MPYRDDFGRAINYLRVSVTDRCNLRCVYCMPAEGIKKRPHGDILRYEELALVVRAAADLGISKVRLTGGEPLTRLGLASFVGMVASTPGIDDLALTTNGTLLARHATALKEAGLQRVNVSLDTLQPDRFQMLTRRGHLGDTLAGLDAARRAGLDPVKINMVVVRGLNDDEIGDFARKTQSDGWHVRFIELMPIGGSAEWAGDGVVGLTEVRARVEAALGPLKPVRGPTGNGPARYYRQPTAQGTVGFISARSEHFCSTCNRLRLTADGRLRPCLMSSHEIDLRSRLRAGADQDEIRLLIADAIQHKPERHHLDEALAPRDRTMAEIGG